MKQFLVFILLFPLLSIAQKGKPASGIDSVLLDSNILFQFINGQKQSRGSVTINQTGTSYWNYDPLYQSLWSIDAKRNSTQSGRWNFVAMPGAGDSLTSESGYNVFIGPGAGNRSKASKNQIAIGWEALKNCNGNDNTAISEDALYSLLSGFGNNAVGRGAIISLTRGNHNNAFGYNALQGLLSGDENYAGGSYAMAFMAKGSGNIAIGPYAMERNDSYMYPGISFDNGIALGYLAGFNSYGNNIFNIGAYTETGRLVNNAGNIGNALFFKNIPTSFKLIGGARVGINIEEPTEALEVKGNVKADAIIAGRKMWADDNYLNVETSTGTKRIPLQEVAAATRAVTAQQNQTVAIYGTDGKLLGHATFQIKQ